MRRIAVIGTAGRGTDRALLSSSKYGVMMRCLRAVVAREKPDAGVSGGAAWADHCLVTLHLEDGFPGSLWLPEHPDDLAVTKVYHSRFSDVLGRNTWAEMMTLPMQRTGRFLDRNSQVAQEATTFLAMTFGDRWLPKDGGTADTVRKMLRRGLRGYHLDLNTEKLWKLPQ